MPVGYGGWIRNKSKDTRHPKHGYRIEWYDNFGSQKSHEEVARIIESGGVVNCTVRADFRFEDTGMERDYLFALATRYKQQKFMENIL